jgi:hypothetical protein
MSLRERSDDRRPRHTTKQAQPGILSILIAFIIGVIITTMPERKLRQPLRSRSRCTWRGTVAVESGRSFQG